MQSSPRRLVVLTIGGGLLSGAALLSGYLRPVHASKGLALLCVTVAGLALAGMFWAAYRLREGIRKERWPARMLAPYRRIVEHRAWTSGIVLMFVALVASLVASRQWRTCFWAIFCMMEMLTQLSSALGRPRTRGEGGGPRRGWGILPRLWSEHWGER